MKLRKTIVVASVDSGEQSFDSICDRCQNHMMHNTISVTSA